MAYRLGVDLGTTFTAAAVDDGSGPTMVGLGNRALQVPSVLFLKQDGTFLFGEAAERRAAVEPDLAVREFKRRLGDSVPILVAGRPFSPQALTAGLLGWVVERVVERQGSAPDEVVLTYPANWGGYKRELLDQVVTLADLPGAVTCTEPEAAASQYTARSRLSPGDQVVVYDLGGGTFDVCVLQKQEVGFRILGSPNGVEHLGGIDFDAAVFGQVLAELGDAADRLDPVDPLVTAGVARLRRECVEAKEALSNDVDAVVPVTLPGLSVSVRVTRTDFEALITPALQDTLAAVRRALRSANTSADRIAAVVLVGGSSRIPLVSHLLQAEFGGRMAMDIHPKHDVALGALRYQQRSQEATPLPPSDLPQWPTRDLASGPALLHEASPTAETPVAADASSEDASAVAEAPPGSSPPVSSAPSSSPSSSPGWSEGLKRWRNAHSRRAALIVTAAVVAVLSLVAVAGAVVLNAGDDDKKPTAGGSTATPTVTTSAEDLRITKFDVIVPIDKKEGNGVDLYVVDADRATELVGGEADQRFPSVSRDRKLLQYASLTDGKWIQMVVRLGGQPEELFDPPLPSGRYCPGKLAWPRDLRGDAAIVCWDVDTSPTTTPPTSSPPTTEPTTTDPTTTDPTTTDPTTEPTTPQTSLPTDTGLPCEPDCPSSPETLSPTPAMAMANHPILASETAAETSEVRLTQFVYLAKINKDGQVNGKSMEKLTGFPEEGVGDISFTDDGGLVVSIEKGSESGIYYWPGDGSGPSQLTSGRDSDAVVSPKRPDDRFVFTRDGDLFLARIDDETPKCTGKLVVDDETDRNLCRLTSDDKFDEGPAWSWDGESIAFLRAASESEESPRAVKRLELANPDQVVDFSTELEGLDIVGEPSWASR